MQQSRRELIINEVTTRLQAAIAPVPVIRQPTTALERDHTPALILNVVSDTPLAQSNDRVERALVLTCIGHARDPTDGFAVADDLLCRAHRALAADVSVNGLALQLSEQETDYQSEDADAQAVAIAATYRITYRTLVSDITQGG